MKLLLGDCLYKLKELKDNSVDSIVTDPPYGLSFMGKQWDYDVPSQEIWEECIRVLKPGGHLLAFAGSRTYHRMAVRIEDAGFDIRDQIMWVYGSGFPKSLNIGKGVDKKLGNEREVVRVVKRTGKNDDIYGAYRGNNTETKGNTEWEGWGTALKPAHEPIVMARKPLSQKTVVDNVLEWGTGGINIDESRISTDEDQRRASKGGENGLNNTNTFKIRERTIEEQPKHDGRFPANIIFDEEAGKLLDEQSGISKSTGGTGKIETNQIYGKYNKRVSYYNFGDTGGASRFFYCPKTSKKERNEGVDNNHPTVKPTNLMLYLIRLVTPKGGTTLDPFMGSGSTGKAAIRGGFDFIGIEMEEEYFRIANARIQYEFDLTGYEIDKEYYDNAIERIERHKRQMHLF